MTTAPSMWLGSHHSEARAGYHRARDAGLSPLRALVIGTVASFKDCWTFRKNLAAKVGCSVRTVQRALTQAREEGLIGVHRAKKTEVPPGWSHGPVTCGWSHRFTVGWGKAGEAVKTAVEQAKARWFVRHSMPAAALAPRVASVLPAATKPATPNQRRSWTAAELDAELERLATEKPPPA